MGLCRFGEAWAALRAENLLTYLRGNSRLDARDPIRDRRESRRVTDRTVTENTAHAQLEAKSEDGRARSAGFIPFCISASAVRPRGARVLFSMRFDFRHISSRCTVWTKTSYARYIYMRSRPPHVRGDSHFQSSPRSFIDSPSQARMCRGTSKSLQRHHDQSARLSRPLPLCHRLPITHLQPNPLLD